MSIYITSDTHFNHLNILKYCPGSRPFNNVHDMNEAIIEKWNALISPDDEIIHCGDFFMGNLSDIDSILSRLNGKITLIRGNHDSKNRIEKYKEFGIEVKDIHYLSYKGRFFIFCHFPIANEEFMRMVREDNSEVILCYGHLHDNAPKGLIDGTFHVGLDTNDLCPVNINTIWVASRAEEEKKDIPAITDPACYTCCNYKITCKGQDGGCERWNK